MARVRSPTRVVGSTPDRKARKIFTLQSAEFVEQQAARKMAPITPESVDSLRCDSHKVLRSKPPQRTPSSPPSSLQRRSPPPRPRSPHKPPLRRPRRTQRRQRNSRRRRRAKLPRILRASRCRRKPTRAATVKRQAMTATDSRAFKSRRVDSARPTNGERSSDPSTPALRPASPFNQGRYSVSRKSASRCKAIPRSWSVSSALRGASI